MELPAFPLAAGTPREAHAMIRHSPQPSTGATSIPGGSASEYTLEQARDVRPRHLVDVGRDYWHQLLGGLRGNLQLDHVRGQLVLGGHRSRGVGGNRVS